jgi:hypothetical protein
LGGDRGGNHRRRLAEDTREAYWTHHARNVQALCLHPVRELRLLGGGADQAEPAGIAAPQDGFAQALVERVAVGHHEVAGSGRGVADAGFGGVRCFDGHVGWAVRREQVLAFIDPGYRARQLGQRTDDGGANVTGAE